MDSNEHFSCVAGQAAVRRAHYRFGLYDEFGSGPSVGGLARDLSRSCARSTRPNRKFRTLRRQLRGPLPPTKPRSSVSAGCTCSSCTISTSSPRLGPEQQPDTGHADFSFSFAGAAFFVVGLHAASSRTTRRFAWPTLVFNPHQQFDHLRETGRYRRFQEVIRTAERSLQGDINPMLSDFGRTSEASQYSGRQVDDEWRCPFRAKAAAEGQQAPGEGGGQ